MWEMNVQWCCYVALQMTFKVLYLTAHLLYAVLITRLRAEL
jgi:hypothetical protein